MKLFNQKLHDKTDSRAKDALKNLLKDSNYSILDNEDIHGVDLFLYHNGIHKTNIEVEIKMNWKPKTKFNWPDVNFLRRKEKYCSLNQPTIFVLFNSDCTQYISVTGDIVMSSPLQEVRNKYNSSGEFFRKIPLNKIEINSIYKTIERTIK